MHRIKALKELKAALPLLMLVLLATNVSAIGIAKAFGAAEFEPNKEISLHYYVFNDEHKAGSAIISLEGSLKDKAIVEPSFVNYTEDEEFIPFTVKITLPDQFEGDLSVVVESEPKEHGQLTARVKVVQQVLFRQSEKKEETPLQINETRPKVPSLRELILPIQVISLVKTTGGRAMLYIALLATIISVLLYLFNTFKSRPPEEIVEDETKDVVGIGNAQDKGSAEYNQEMLDYLKNGYKIGIADELLIGKLHSIGWDRETIDKHVDYAKQNME